MLIERGTMPGPLFSGGPGFSFWRLTRKGFDLACQLPAQTLLKCRYLRHGGSKSVLHQYHIVVIESILKVFIVKVAESNLSHCTEMPSRPSQEQSTIAS